MTTLYRMNIALFHARVDQVNILKYSHDALLLTKNWDPTSRPKLFAHRLLALQNVKNSIFNADLFLKTCPISQQRYNDSLCQQLEGVKKDYEAIYKTTMQEVDKRISDLTERLDSIDGQSIKKSALELCFAPGLKLDQIGRLKKLIHQIESAVDRIPLAFPESHPSKPLSPPLPIPHDQGLASLSNDLLAMIFDCLSQSDLARLSSVNRFFAALLRREKIALMKSVKNKFFKKRFLQHDYKEINFLVPDQLKLAFIKHPFQIHNVNENVLCATLTKCTPYSLTENNSYILFLDIDKKTVIETLTFNYQYDIVSKAFGDKLVLAVSSDLEKRVEVRLLENGQILCVLNTPHPLSICDVILQGNLLTSLSVAEGKIKIWNLTTRSCIEILHDPKINYQFCLVGIRRNELIGWNFVKNEVIRFPLTQDYEVFPPSQDNQHFILSDDLLFGKNTRSHISIFNLDTGEQKKFNFDDSNRINFIKLHENILIAVLYTGSDSYSFAFIDLKNDKMTIKSTSFRIGEITSLNIVDNLLLIGDKTVFNFDAIGIYDMGSCKCIDSVTFISSLSINPLGGKALVADGLTSIAPLSVRDYFYSSPPSQ